MTLAAVAVLAMSVGGCRGSAQSSEQTTGESVVAPPERKPELEVGVSGCAGVIVDPPRERVCLIRPSKRAKPLYLWLDGANDPQVELRLSGTMLAAKPTIDVDGVMLSVELPQPQGRLELSTPQGDWAIELRSVSDRFEALREDVQASWKQGDADTALQRFERALTELGPDEATLLACAIGKVVLVAGDHDRVLAIAKQVSSSPVVSCVGKASLLAAYIQIYLRPDFNAAELSLAAAEAVQGSDLDTRIAAAYLRGVLEHWLGNNDESLVALDQAARLAWLVGDDNHHPSALIMQATSLASLGRFVEAETLAAQVEQRAGSLHPTLAVNIRSGIGWITVLRREDDPSVPDPSAALRSDISIYVERGENRNLASQRLNLALALVQNQDLDGAAAELAQVDREALNPDLLVWYELTAARIALLRKRVGVAENHLDRARLYAELIQDRDLEWRVVITTAELERARGRLELAVKRYRQASDIADGLALSIAGDAGRSLFVTAHSRADFGLAEILLSQGNAEDALCTVIAARARHLRGLWAGMRPQLSAPTEQRYRDLLSRHHQRKQEIAARLENSWELSTVELQQLRERLGAEGERADKLLAEATSLLEDGAPIWTCERVLPQRPNHAVMTMMPNFEEDRWTAMLALRTLDGELTIETADVQVTDLHAAGSSILTQVGPSLAGVDVLRVIPVGVFAEVDFHVLWLERGAPELTINYSLGLGANPNSSPLGFRAAVVAGSTDLGASTREEANVAMQLETLGWTVESRWSPPADPQPDLLHYIGHGSSGGPLGWRSAIDLPGVGRLSAIQLVAGQRAPALVVLGACSTGRVQTVAIDGGMNLAAAFLLAGSRLVIAPIRDVDDATAYELGVGLYRELDPAEPDALARALARMQKQQFDRDAPATGAQSFSSWRAWVP